MTPPINAYMYEREITRVKDVYGRFYWLATRYLNTPEKTLIPICTDKGLRRNHISAGHDNQNNLHRENIAEIRQTKISFWFQDDE